jgi:hypothetical protein
MASCATVTHHEASKLVEQCHQLFRVPSVTIFTQIEQMQCSAMQVPREGVSDVQGSCIDFKERALGGPVSHGHASPTHLPECVGRMMGETAIPILPQMQHNLAQLSTDRTMHLEPVWLLCSRFQFCHQQEPFLLHDVLEIGMCAHMNVPSAVRRSLVSYVLICKQA